MERKDKQNVLFLLAVCSFRPKEQCGRSETIVLKDENDIDDEDHGHDKGHRINLQYNVSAVQVSCALILS